MPSGVPLATHASHSGPHQVVGLSVGRAVGLNVGMVVVGLVEGAIVGLVGLVVGLAVEPSSTQTLALILLLTARVRVELVPKEVAIATWLQSA